MDPRTDLLHLDLADRVALHPNGDRLFINFEKMRIRSQDEVDMVASLVTKACQKPTDRVDVVVNCDGFGIDKGLALDWARMVARLEDQFYSMV